MATNIPVDAQGNVPNLTKAVSIAGFDPDPAATYPSYVVAGAEEPPGVDENGHLMTRGPVFTDEGGLRDSFNGAALDPEWTLVPAGMGFVVAGGSLTITNTDVAGAMGYISRPIDFMPVIANLFLTLSARAAVSTGRDFFFGFYNTADPNVATEYAEWMFLGVGGNTTSETRTASSSAAGGTQGIGVNVTCTSTVTAGFRTIAVDGESGIFRDGAVNLPTPTTRSTQSQQLMGPYTPLFFALGFRNAAVVGAVGMTATIDTLFVKNANRLVVNTAF